MSTRNLLSVLCLGLLAAVAAYAQTNGAPSELNLTLGEQRVRFAPTRSFQEMRLEVVNSVGEIVFAHMTTGAEFDWNLRAGNGEALAPGLYRYALTLKFSEDLSRQHTGHFIVEKGQDQIWLTASDGAEVSGTTLNAARSGGRSIAGLRTSEDKSIKRDVSGREIVDDQGNKLTGSTKATKQEAAALLGTQNIVAKFDVGGVNLIDSAMIETGGNVGLGTAFPNAKLSVSANSVAPPSAPGIIGYFANANESNTFLTADSYGNSVVHSDFLFRRARGTMAAPLALQADDIIGQIQARGYGATGFATTARAGIRLTAAENWSDTAQGAYLAFMTTPKLNASINVERMRITDAGRVGIGTTTPGAMLHATGSATNGVYGFSTASDGNGVYGAANTGANAYGVWGSSASGYGVVGETSSANGSGVFGTSIFGNGVVGTTDAASRAGVVAQGSGNTGTALRIESGRIKVLGAGLSTATPVFIHQATAGNIAGHITRIDHPLTNGDPNTILIVTPNNNSGGGASVGNNHAIGVFYDGGASKWTIFNQDAAAMSVNAAFNVLVIKP